MQGRRTRAAVTLVVAMLYIVCSCTALAPEATHSATPSPIELERATPGPDGAVQLRDRRIDTAVCQAEAVADEGRLDYGRDRTP